MAQLARRAGRIGGLAVALGACASHEPVAPELVLAGSAMGTSYSVTLPGVTGEDSDRGALVRQVIERVESRMSTYRPDSEVSRFNRHELSEPLVVSAETYAVLAVAQEVSFLTEGAFDITVGPLVDAWGFGPQEVSAPPTADSVQHLLERTGWQKLRLDPQRSAVGKTSPQLTIDLSAIAKGYAVDLVADTLERRGYCDYLVEVGGELRVRGRRADGSSWRVGVEFPNGVARSIHRILQVSDTAVATSGDYRNFRTLGGQRLGHVLDPRTGWPSVNQVLSATVLHASATHADALATALLVLGERDGMDLAEREGLAVLLLVAADDQPLREVPSQKFRAILQPREP